MTTRVATSAPSRRRATLGIIFSEVQSQSLLWEDMSDGTRVIGEDNCFEYKFFIPLFVLSDMCYIVIGEVLSGTQKVGYNIFIQLFYDGLSI